MAIPILSGLSQVVEPYEGLIVDVWGVLHDGGRAFPDALECLKKLRLAHKRIVLLSNAPRRATRIAATLRSKGVTEALYERVISSGEAVHLMLSERSDPAASELGFAYYGLGPVEDKGLLDGLPYRETPTLSEADFILCIGLRSARDEPADYEGLLAEGAALGLPMICANPDKMVLRRGIPELCAGVLAARYQELGGTVQYFGKPYPPVYRLCFAQLGVEERRGILALGDGLETDIAGAHKVGIDSVLVTGGLLAFETGGGANGRLDRQALERVCAAHGLTPRAAMPVLAW